MFGVIRSYQDLTGFQPVELLDVCTKAGVMSVDFSSQGSLTTSNSL